MCNLTLFFMLEVRPNSTLPPCTTFRSAVMLGIAITHVVDKGSELGKAMAAQREIR